MKIYSEFVNQKIRLEDSKRPHRRKIDFKIERTNYISIPLFISFV
jgi:hypothetical protein